MAGYAIDISRNRSLSNNWSRHAYCHYAPNLRRHSVVLVRGHEIELVVPDIGAIDHVELSRREGVRVGPIMRSVLSQAFSAQVHDHAELQHLISTAEVDRHALAQLLQAA